MPFCRNFRWLPTLVCSASVCSALALLAGCGDSGKASPAATDEDSTAQPAATETPSAGSVELTLDGVHEVLSGGARLEVRELNPVVNLAVTAVFASNHDNLLQFQLAFQGVENAVGAHSSPLAGEINSPAVAEAYIDQVSYRSKSGSLDVTLTSDRTIQGRFDAALTVDAQGTTDPGGVPASAKDFSVSGNFEGTWSVVCRSPVLDLPGDHSVANSPYCNSLQF